MAQENIEIKKKQFTYRGKTLEELKELDVREFAKHLRSKQRRMVIRNFQKIEDFVKRAKEKVSKSKNIRTHLRNIVVVPELVGMKISIYNGKEFIPVEIKPEMLGHVFGEFSPSRGKVQHGSAGVGATKGSKFKAKK
jgi:small subunit ribosomal protein S19